MLEDTKAALSDLDKVTVFFRQLEDECLVTSKSISKDSVHSEPALMSSCSIPASSNKVPFIWIYANYFS